MIHIYQMIKRLKKNITAEEAKIGSFAKKVCCDLCRIHLVKKTIGVNFFQHLTLSLKQTIEVKSSIRRWHQATGFQWLIIEK